MRREKQYDSEVKKKADADRYAIEQSQKQIGTTNRGRRCREISYRSPSESRMQNVSVSQVLPRLTRNGEREAEAEIIRLTGLGRSGSERKNCRGVRAIRSSSHHRHGRQMLPDYAKEIAAPLGNIDQITVVDTGGGANGGAGKVTGYATDLMASLQQTLKASSESI